SDLPQNRLANVDFGPEYRRLSEEDKRKERRKAYWIIPPAVAITFQGAGYNSAVATDSHYWIKREGIHSMRPGRLDQEQDAATLRRVVLHEFGHALGLQHEHRNPAAGIKWNVKAVKEYYAKTQGWSEKEIEENVLNPLKADRSNYTAFDSKSIMVYAIP